MTANEDDMVFLTTCHSSIEASMLHQFLGTGGIRAFVQGESHRSVLGILGSYVELRVLVPQTKLEDAREALRAFTAGSREQAEADDDQDDDVVALPLRGKRTGIALLVAMTLTFGCGHFYVRAWLRGLMFAATQLVGILLLASLPLLGASLIVLAIATDAIGAVIALRAAQRPEST